VGLLLAPVTGAELRDRLRRLIEGEVTDSSSPAWAPEGERVLDLTMESTP
jgi:hypothetical protein